MSLFSRVSWRDGLFLLPQHFQQADRHQEAVLQRRLAGVAPWGYGVLELRLDEAALRERRVVLSRCEAVLPDGLVVSIPDWDGVPAGLTLTDADFGERRRLSIYLVVPEAREGVPLISDQERGDVRYLEREQPVPDVHRPQEAPQSIQVARPNLHLAHGGEALRGLVALPIAEVDRLASGALQYREDYIPPCLKLRASAALRRRAERLLTRVGAEAARQSAAMVLPQQPTPTDLQRYFRLHTLLSHLPVLRNLVAQQQAHPQALYDEWLRLCGGLLLFEEQARRALLDAARTDPYFPLYDHHRIAECLVALEDWLETRMGTVEEELWARVALTQEDNLWTGALEEQHLKGELYLEVQGTLSAQELAHLPRQLKIGAPDQVPSLIRQAVTGLEAMPVSRPPLVVPARTEATYLRVLPREPYWADVAERRGISFYMPGKLSRLRLELLWVHPRALEARG